ncbi:MAG TPA: oxygen-independent coproporphyrinogen III oxidase [Thermoanaerobaculia bacterium]|nr:oxygen-independent coproporphyrinogen III oxidase [Thermoanaerobaculia bacterium]
MQDLWQPIQFDRGMLRKYDRPGPRYTSYPTAPQFEDGFGHTDYVRLLEQSAETDNPLSLYVHIPFCAHRCFFCGCNVTVSHDRTWGRRYLPLVAREMEIVSERLAAHRREVVQIHWGGGTPTFLPPEDLAELMLLIRRNFRISKDCEIGVEVDPRECSPAHLDVFAEAGVNRLSMGLQELDPQVQKAVNRVQTLDQTWGVLEGARRRGLQSVNLDLIYGLPFQTPERFAATMREVVKMAPDRLALFNFAYLPAAIPHQRALDAAALPSPDAKLRMLEEAIAALTKLDYVFIGMDHFARPQDPLAQALRDRTLTRNFQGYSTCAKTDLVGFGVSSIGEVGGGYAQNSKSIAEYGAALQNDRLPVCRGLALTSEDHLRRDVIQRLMCHFGLDKRDVERRYEIDSFDRYFAAEIEELVPMVRDDLVEMGADRIEITPLGRLLVRNVAMAFDAYLGKTAVSYSRTV